MMLLNQEFRRKLIHSSGIFFIPLIFWKPFIVTVVMMAALFFYLGVEFFGKNTRVYSWIEESKRVEEKGFLSWGVINLALATGLIPLLFSADIAAMALSQVYLADTGAALMGRRWGKRKIFYSPVKTWVGFFTFWFIAFSVSCLFVPWRPALGIGLVGALVESLPFRSMDNLLIPLVVCLVYICFVAGSFFQSPPFIHL